ncbi:dipeptide ABC transporter ATP-binding protein [Phytohabitans kaempferiae]|uniref:Dipeptide ABC transporter ATP-binding protein n=1 Tax=Phytohabitans kaempferiae TaxID=1620943 RepID=A0ABV6MHN1_9ACTN
MTAPLLSRDGDATRLPDQAADTLVTIRGLKVSFDGVRRLDGTHHHVVDDVDLTVTRGKILAVVGESGSGKSVTARTLVGLAGTGARVTARRFDMFGEDVTNYTERDWRRLRGRRVGFVLQDALTSLDPLKTIEQEIAEGLDPTLSKTGRAERVTELLAAVGIPEPQERRRQYPHQLSGGQRQRALIASAIAGDPGLLIADEPTTALDVTIQAQILELIAGMARQGRGVILISHDLSVVANLADEVLVMHEGRIVESGPVRQVIDTPSHDYTRQLIAAVPGAHSRGRRLALESAPRVTTRTAPLSDRPAVVEVNGVGKWYRARGGREFRAAEQVSFVVRPGEIVGLVGESGSGKSTVAKIVTGLLRPDAGEVVVAGTEWSSSRTRRAHLGLVQLIAQDSLGSFDPRYTVREIIAETVRLRIRDRRQRNRRIAELLDLVRLPADTIDRLPRHLSGGQRQRVSIARALGCEPRVLVCDEPVSALDVSVQAQILDLVDDLRAHTDAALLFISHDIGVIHHLADTVLVMHRGRIVERGAAHEVFTNPTDDYTRSLISAVPVL